MVGFIIFTILALASLLISIFKSIGCIRNKVMKVDFRKLLKELTFIGAGFVASFVLVFVFIQLWANNNPNAIEWVQTIIGSLFSGLLLYTTLHCFLLHYYKKDKPELLDKWLFRILVISFPLMFAFIFLLTNGFASYVTYPLVKSIPIFSEKISVTFYAICILTGAVYVYFYCDHKFYKEYGKHGILDSTFLVAFPAGIVGARLFYVIGVFEEQFKGKPIGTWFDLTSGGLTILGGAITGIVCGVAWFLWRNRKYSIWFAVDTIVPAILLAQAVGRWGNFFNCEVHGGLVNENYFRFLPSFIFNNIHYSSSYPTGVAPEGMLFSPFFLIESVTNFLGFFVLAHLFGRKLKNLTKAGDLAFGYIIWYGLTRVFMEPLRYEDFQMNTWSWIWSMAFILVGCFAISINHLIRNYLKVRKDNSILQSFSFRTSIFESIGFFVVGSTLVIVGSIMMANGTFVESPLVLNTFSIGLILLILGISVFSFLINLVFCLVSVRKFNEKSV